MKFDEKCPHCGCILVIGHNDKGIVSFKITPEKPANVVVCEHCWFEKRINNQIEIKN